MILLSYGDFLNEDDGVMREKMMKRFEKRITAIFVSFILTIGMIGGSCLLEVKAEEISANSVDPNGAVVEEYLELTIRGYEGEELSEFGDVVLRMFESAGTNGEYDEIRPSSIQKTGENTLLYTAHYERSMSRGVYWYYKAGSAEDYSLIGGFTGGYGGTTYDQTISYVGFMDGSQVYYERYYKESSHNPGPNDGVPSFVFRDAGRPEKSNHKFLGWSETKGSNETISASLSNQPRYVNRYYAVWEHPSEDTWDWNSDNDNHWKECSCGELKTAEEAHAWNEGVITRQPTDTMEGERTYTCADCGKTKTEPIPATGKPTISGNNPTLPSNPETPGSSDIPTNTPGTGTNPGNTGNTVTVVNPSSNTGTATEKNKEPKTGDTPYVEIYATVAMIAGMAYLLLYFCDDKHGISEEEKQELMSRLICWAKKGGYFRRIVALTAIFFLLCYYHSIGKQSHIQWKTT